MKLAYKVRHGSLGIGDDVMLDKSGLDLAKEMDMDIAPMYSLDDLIESVRRLPDALEDNGSFVEEHEQYHDNYMVNRVKGANRCGNGFKSQQSS